MEKIFNRIFITLAVSSAVFLGMMSEKATAAIFLSTGLQTHLLLHNHALLYCLCLLIKSEEKWEVVTRQTVVTCKHSLQGV